MNALRWKINKNFRTSLTLIAVILAVISGCKSDSPTDPGGENPVSGNATILTSLTATPNTIGVGGSARIAAIVVDENATPLAGKIVSFSTNGGEITPYDTTNAIGVAEAIYRGPSEVGVFRVYARLGEQVDSISVTIDSQIMQNLQVIPENGRILANGFSTDLLTISVWDTDQNPIANARVALQSNAGSLPPLSRRMVQERRSQPCAHKRRKQILPQRYVPPLAKSKLYLWLFFPASLFLSKPIRPPSLLTVEIQLHRCGRF